MRLVASIPSHMVLPTVAHPSVFQESVALRVTVTLRTDDQLQMLTHIKSPVS